MAKKPEKELARLLYIEQGLTLTEISNMLEVNPNTLTSWSNKGGWKEQRDARQLSSDKLIQMYREQSAVIVDAAKAEGRALTSTETDSLVKLSTSIKNLDKSVGVSPTMAVLRNFNMWLMNVEPELAGQLVDYQMQYVKGLIDAQK